MSELCVRPAEGLVGIKSRYLFSEVRARTVEFLSKFGGEVLNMGVGDIAYPLSPYVCEKMAKACTDMADNVRFRGYPPEGGYDFLKSAIVEDYKRKGIKTSEDEIFVSDGAKSDAGSFTDIFAHSSVVIFDPVYPVYADCAEMCKNDVILISGNKQNNFMPTPRGLERRPYIIWLCSPSNPTGGAFNVKALSDWVSFALETGSIILYDAAYEAFAEEGAVRSVYEVGGAKECAVELCSLSKSAGFTGVRCSWVRIPRQIKVGGRPVGELWRRRQSAKFNGVSYVTQRGAEAALSQRGRAECREILAHYKNNMKVFTGFFESVGVWFTGGVHSPYIWFECPNNMGSWDFFDLLLRDCRIVGTPGCGFGKSGEGFFRLSCFAKEENALEAVERLKKIM